MSTTRPKKNRRRNRVFEEADGPRLHRAIANRMEFARCNYGNEDGPFTEDAALEEVMADCGMTPDGYCTLAGTEFCDWDCPFSS